MHLMHTQALVYQPTAGIALVAHRLIANQYPQLAIPRDIVWVDWGGFQSSYLIL